MLPRLIDLGNPVAPHPLWRDLVSLWLPLPNNSGGPTNFDLLRRNDSALTNGPTWTTGPNARASILLDAADDLLSAPDSTSLQPAKVSVAAAVRVLSWSGSNGGYATIAARVPNNWASGYGLVSHPEGGGQVGFQVNGYGGSGTAYVARSLVSFGTDYLLVGSYDLTNVQFWMYGLDGTVQTASTAYTTAIIHPGSQPFRTGFDASRDPFNARVHWRALWSRGLAPDEPAALFDQWRRDFPDTLRRYTPRARLFGGTGSTVTSPPHSPGQSLPPAPAPSHPPCPHRFRDRRRPHPRVPSRRRCPSPSAASRSRPRPAP